MKLIRGSSRLEEVPGCSALSRGCGGTVVKSVSVRGNRKLWLLQVTIEARLVPSFGPGQPVTARGSGAGPGGLGFVSSPFQNCVFSGDSGRVCRQLDTTDLIDERSSRETRLWPHDGRGKGPLLNFKLVFFLLLLYHWHTSLYIAL